MAAPPQSYRIPQAPSRKVLEPASRIPAQPVKKQMEPIGSKTAGNIPRMPNPTVGKKLPNYQLLAQQKLKQRLGKK